MQARLSDRSLMPGDVVRRLIEGQESQRGFVADTRVRCHVQVVGRNRVICDVDSRHLEPLKVRVMKGFNWFISVITNDLMEHMQEITFQCGF